MQQVLKGRRTLVTGASSGIGKAVAERFAMAGAAVAINYRREAGPAEEAAALVRERGGQAVALQADIAEEDQVERLVRATVEALGGLDILVANAGIQRDHAFAEMPLADWRRVIDVNLTGQFLCARAALRQFRAQGPRQGAPARGNILFMNSVHQVIPWAGHANYAAAKGGLKLLMESLAQEVAHEKIRVNAIAPGAIATAINRAVWSDERSHTDLLRLIPYGRIGEPDDVARAAVWLASDDSDYVVGTTLFVDGGMTLYPGFRDNG